jgi:uncharacterized protein (DUF433 family)
VLRETHGGIVKDAGVMGGKPAVRGTRIPVELILDWLSGNLDFDEFFAAYPELTIDDVQAALAYARDVVRAAYLRSPVRKEAFAVAKRRRESSQGRE